MSRSRTLTTPKALAAAGLLPEQDLAGIASVAERYAIGVTSFLAGRIDPDDPEDPIRRMFVPSTDELVTTPDERPDPIGDDAHTPVPGIVHRYPDRVLLKPVAVCPVYCRFCFRREMVGPQTRGTLSPAALEKALTYVRDHADVREVILTGGDPFMLSPERARTLTDAIAAIPHVEVIRWHTRMPVADPERVTPGFADALRHPDKAVYVSIHINHVRELSVEARAAARRLADAGISLLAQSVLLRGVNDSADALADLMRALVAAGIRPYYLHHPDLAPGTGHFRLSVAEGQALYSALRDRVSGLAVPHYVIDIPGGVSKANAASSDVVETPDGKALRGRDGRLYPYED